MSRRKLSHIEHIADFNIACFVRLEGSVSPEQLRSALDRMQRKHPALRALIRDEPDGLYYEADSAPEIPLRIVRRTAEDDYRREREAELNSDFAFDEPQLRVVWLRSELETDLLFTTSHRICDLMSILIVVKETLRALHSSEELIPYQAITTQDISGGYAPAKPWNGKLTVWLLNWVLRLLPSSRPAPQNKEHLAEWRASRSFSDSLRQRCKTEGVSVHSAFLVALDRALFAVFGKRSPRWITCPIDLRRGRLPGLKDDMLFYGGGNFKVRTGRGRDRDFWAAARAINDEMRGQIEREVQEVPGRLHFFDLLRPLRSGQVQWLVRMSDALQMKSSRLKGFGISNLGNLVVSDADSPFPLKDLRLYTHSLNFRVLGMIPYTVDGEMRLHVMCSQTCAEWGQVDALTHEFITCLQNEMIRTHHSSGELPHTMAAVAP
jgi:hypothetical protein